MVGLALIHPLAIRASNLQKGLDTLLQGANMPADAKAVLITKCADCHSNETRWPVYARIAPGSWLIERDIVEATKENEPLTLGNRYRPSTKDDEGEDRSRKQRVERCHRCNIGHCTGLRSSPRETFRLSLLGKYKTGSEATLAASANQRAARPSLRSAVQAATRWRWIGKGQGWPESLVGRPEVWLGSLILQD